MEPITGKFSGQQWLENGFLAIMYWVTGSGATCCRSRFFAKLCEARGVLRVIGVCWLVTGAIWAAFGTLNYFTHIGLTINTYNASTRKAGDSAAAAPRQQTRTAATSAVAPARRKPGCRFITSGKLKPAKADYRGPALTISSGAEAMTGPIALTVIPRGGSGRQSSRVASGLNPRA